MRDEQNKGTGRREGFAATHSGTAGPAETRDEKNKGKEQKARLVQWDGFGNSWLREGRREKGENIRH